MNIAKYIELIKSLLDNVQNNENFNKKFQAELLNFETGYDNLIFFENGNFFFKRKTIKFFNEFIKSKPQTEWYAFSEKLIQNGHITYFQEIKAYLLYFDFFEANKPQQKETNIPDEVKKELHNDYFKNNAFKIWERLFENLNINETKRTDLRFMYEIMKYNEQIHKTVTVKNITDWINETYDFNIDKLQYTSIKSKSNENRMSIYNLIK